MSDEVQVYEGGVPDISVSRAPAVVLEEARKAAVALKDVLDKKPKKVMMNNEQYLEYEDWQTVARFYGITAKVESTQFVDYGAAKGFLARALAIRADGMVVSAAEAMCLNDEDKWHSRPKYEFQDVLVDGKKVWDDERKRYKSNKVKVGDEPVPLYQLMSMAQTRACAKVLRNVVSWVVVLAGYKGTPAEEIDSSMEKGGGTATSTAEQTTERKVTEGMAKLMHVLCSKLGVKAEKERHEYVEIAMMSLTGKEAKVTSFAEIEFDLGRKVIDYLQQKITVAAANP
jgi:hypothetical protein